MPQTLTFAKVFGPVTKEGAKWTRWDYKTGDDTRYVRFRSDQDIPLNTAVNVELEDNKIASWSLAAGNQQAGSESKVHVPSPQNSSQGVAGASERDEQIHRQTATKVAAALLPHIEVDNTDAERFLSDFFGLANKIAAYYKTGDSLPF